MGKWAAAAEPVPDEQWENPKEARRRKKEEERERKRKEKEQKRKEEKEAQKKALEDAVENAPEGSPEREEAEKALEEYRKKEEKKLWKKQMAHVEELRMSLADLPEGSEERQKVEEEIQEILDFWKKKEEDALAALEPPPPEPPKGYKWGGVGSYHGGRLSEGALWDLLGLLHMTAREGDLREFKQIFQLAEDSGVDMQHLLVHHRSFPEERNTLHWAAEGGNSEVLEICLRYSPNIFAAAKDGDTPLSIATGV